MLPYGLMIEGYIRSWTINSPSSCAICQNYLFRSGDVFSGNSEMHKLRQMFFLILHLLLSLPVWPWSSIPVVDAEPLDADTQHRNLDKIPFHGPTADEWELPRAWTFRRQIARAVSSGECWPRTKFGLLQSTSGCPSGSWKSGSMRHLLRATSSVSSQNYLRVDIAADSVDLHFCMRDPEAFDDKEELDCLGHDPSFPPGSYCIFNGQKANVYEQCPVGFHWSALGVDDVGEIEKRPVNVPTGEYFPTFSHYYLCCRNDSSPSSPMTLPASRSFILLPLNAEKTCQEIRGLRARMFSLFLDTESESYFGHPDKSNAPYAATEVVLDGGGSCSGNRYGKGLKLHLCYYSRW